MITRTIPKNITYSRFTSDCTRFIISIIAVVFSLYLIHGDNTLLYEMSKYLLVFYSISLGQIIIKYSIYVFKCLYYLILRKHKKLVFKENKYGV